MSQFQNVSPPYDGGIFDCMVRRKLSKSEIPDFERERIENFNRWHPDSIGIPRIEIFDQRRDRPEWDVLKPALITFTSE